MPSRSRHEPVISPPCIGTLIDDDQLELVSVLGEGGFSTVFLARSAHHSSYPPGNTPLYAVKVLQSPPGHEPVTHPRQRQLHLREATLHSLCSSHSSIAPLRKIVFYHSYTCLVMDYYPEGDLFSAILTHSIYLAHPHLIKSVFLQILDGVAWCHDKQVYLRDLKPENVLVAENRRKIYLTDFGLATSESESTEFKTGSVYHMSPECMGPEPYSPQHNDIWSLGILLLNLVTSRNPWRSAHISDPTFAAYLEYISRPAESVPLLQRILPISSRLNNLLERILITDPSKRISVHELRKEIKRFRTGLQDWYSPDVVFDNGCARCKWELDAEVDENGIVIGVKQHHGEDERENSDFDRAGEPSAPDSPQSAWSEDSLSYSFNSSDSSLSRQEPLPPPQSPIKRLPHNPTACRQSITPSTSSGSLSLPKTPRDLAQFGSLNVFDADADIPVPVPGIPTEVMEEQWQPQQKFNPIANSVTVTPPGQLQTNFGRKLFGRAAHLFGRS